jgi:hypothetical protein
MGRKLFDYGVPEKLRNKGLQEAESWLKNASGAVVARRVPVSNS